MRKLADGGERSGFFSIQRYLGVLKVLDLPEIEVPRPKLLYPLGSHGSRG